MAPKTQGAPGKLDLHGFISFRAKIVNTKLRCTENRLKSHQGVSPMDRNIIKVHRESSKNLPLFTAFFCSKSPLFAPCLSRGPTYVGFGWRLTCAATYNMGCYLILICAAYFTTCKPATHERLLRSLELSIKKVAGWRERAGE